MLCSLTASHCEATTPAAWQGRLLFCVLLITLKYGVEWALLQCLGACMSHHGAPVSEACCNVATYCSSLLQNACCRPNALTEVPPSIVSANCA